jgi:hypothetical protein
MGSWEGGRTQPVPLTLTPACVPGLWAIGYHELFVIDYHGATRLTITAASVESPPMPRPDTQPTTQRAGM